METASCQPERVSSRRLYFLLLIEAYLRVSGVELPSMSKLFRRKGFRLASVAYFLSLGTLAVALFAWFSTSSTFSWFASNKTVDATGMAIKVKADEDVDIEMHVYKYVAQDDGSFKVEKDHKDSSGNIDASLSRYDRIFQDDNNKTPVLLRLTLTGGAYTSGTSKLPLKIYRDTGKYEATNNDGSKFSSDDIDDVLVTYDSNEKLQYEKSESDDDEKGAKKAKHGLSSFISSVITVKAYVPSSDTWSEDSDTALTNSFEVARTTFSSVTNSQQFVTELKAGKSGAAETTKADFLSFEQNLTYYAGDDKICYVYIWIDYDTTNTTLYEGDDGNGLINAYIDQMGSTGVNISYPLLSDISTVEVKK